MAKSNPGAVKLLAAMKKHIKEVNDHEICRRLEILITSEKDDIPAALIKKVFDGPNGIDQREVPEPYTQYVMHYLYMLKRASREKVKEKAPVSSVASKKKSSARPASSKKVASARPTSTAAGKKRTRSSK